MPENDHDETESSAEVDEFVAHARSDLPASDSPPDREVTHAEITAGETAKSSAVRGLVYLTVAAAAYNVVSNLFLPPWAYVPANAAMTAVAVVIGLRIGKANRGDLGLSRWTLRRGILWGFCGMGVVAAVVLVGVVLPWTRGLFEDRRVSGATAAVAFYHVFFRIPLGTVVFEEVLFRGVFLGLGLRIWKTRGAVLFSCAVFGLWHILPAWGISSFNPVVRSVGDGPEIQIGGIALAVVGTFLAGIWFCWFRLRPDSLAASLILHFSTNAIPYAVAWIFLNA